MGRAGGDGCCGECGVGQLTVVWRGEAYDGRASRKISLREIGETYRGGGRLIGSVARAGMGSGV
jgi:hypothetical protein